mgnify:CR=1 FL=1
MTTNLITSSKNINLHLVEVEDAEFIVNLRLKKGQFLSKTDSDVEKQIEWIKEYKNREKFKEEYYFIIEDKNFNKLGTIRIYNINYEEKLFTFGSFIVNNHPNNKYIALESITAIFDFAFNILQLEQCYFDCRKNNKKANDFYIRYQAEIIKENESDYFYQYNKETFLKNISNYKLIYDPIS